MNILKERILVELRAYEESAKEGVGELKNDFVKDVYTLAKTYHYLCKVEEHCERAKHKHMPVSEVSVNEHKEVFKPNIFAV